MSFVLADETPDFCCFSFLVHCIHRGRRVKKRVIIQTEGKQGYKTSGSDNGEKKNKEHNLGVEET